MSTFLGSGGSVARGIRNNNPGNLIKTAIKWQGKIPHAQNTDTRFEQFKSVEYGLRAMYKDLINDISKGKNTITKLITEYAPAFENNTQKYIESVARTVGIGKDEEITKINYDLLMLLGRAIVKVENGSQHTMITDAMLDKAISMVGNYKLRNVIVNISKIGQKTAKFVPVLLFFYSLLSLYCLIN